MTRARGQSSRTSLNREYPHQVLALSMGVGGKMLDNVDAFHTSRSSPIKKRSIRRDDVWWSLYGFAEQADAESFQAVFGGDLFDLRPPY